MAKYSIEFSDNGDKLEKLTFMGKNYICRTRHFINGIANGLDICLDSQVEKDYPENEELLDLVYELDDLSDAQTLIPKITKIENKIKKGQK